MEANNWAVEMLLLFDSVLEKQILTNFDSGSNK